jgi:hypothetical protein
MEFVMFFKKEPPIILSKNKRKGGEKTLLFIFYAVMLSLVSLFASEVKVNVP